MMNKGHVKFQPMSLLLPLLAMWMLMACATGTENGETMEKPHFVQGTSWWVEDIGGQGVVDMSHTTIEFTDDDGIVGDTGCNRYFGGVEINGSTITAGPLASTRKACSEALMDQESKFFQAMSSVVSWEIADTGLLHLSDADGNSQLRASRAKP